MGPKEKQKAPKKPSARDLLERREDREMLEEMKEEKQGDCPACKAALRNRDEVAADAWDENETRWLFCGNCSSIVKRDIHRGGSETFEIEIAAAIARPLVERLRAAEGSDYDAVVSGIASFHAKLLARVAARDRPARFAPGDCVVITVPMSATLGEAGMRPGAARLREGQTPGDWAAKRLASMRRDLLLSEEQDDESLSAPTEIEIRTSWSGLWFRKGTPFVVAGLDDNIVELEPPDLPPLAGRWPKTLRLRISMEHLRGV